MQVPIIKNVFRIFTFQAASKFAQKKTSFYDVQYLNYVNLPIIYIFFVVFVFSGVSKIIYPVPLISNLSSTLTFLPETAIILITTLLPLVEIGLGLLLVTSLYYEKISAKRKIILVMAMALFIIFLLYSIYGFILGETNECGCFGNIIKSNFGWGMMIRNLVFVLLSIVLVIKDFSLGYNLNTTNNVKKN